MFGFGGLGGFGESSENQQFPESKPFATEQKSPFGNDGLGIGLANMGDNFGGGAFNAQSEPPFSQSQDTFNTQ